jgi:uncharacterized protein
VSIDSRQVRSSGIIPRIFTINCVSQFLISCLLIFSSCLIPSMAKKRKTRKRAVQVEVRKSGVHGRGVYATQFIPEGTRIIEYTGERVSWEAAPNDENDPHTFNFGLDNGEVINPEIGGNDARWINHSCNPNCEATEEDDRIFIDAMRDIQPGEELFYDYALEIDEPITEESKKKYACHCGSSKCRGTMLDTS